MCYQWIQDGVATFEKMRSLGVEFDVRKVPNDSKKDLFDLIKANVRVDYLRRDFNMSIISMVLVVVVATQRSWYHINSIPPAPCCSYLNRFGNR